MLINMRARGEGPRQANPCTAGAIPRDLTPLHPSGMLGGVEGLLSGDLGRLDNRVIEAESD